MSSKTLESNKEPYFEVSELYITTELLQDSFKTLVDENQEKISKSTEDDGYFKDGKSAEMIFNICRKLNLPIEVKYVAVELFDRFMSKHITELHNIVCDSSSKEKQLDWSSVEARIKDQIPLRIITCVQISSKLVSHYKALTPTKVKRLLSSCGLQYSVASVVKSEMRVLRTLEFRISATSILTYVEVLLEVLRRNCSGVQVELLHEVCMKLIDVVYLQKFQIYQQLFVATGCSFDIKVANDFIFISTCVIVASSFILDSESNDMYIEQLSLITCIDEATIIVLTTIILRLSLDLP